MTVLTYEAPYPVYALDWCKTTGAGGASHLPRASYRLALGSFQDDYRNRISIIGLPDENGLSDSPDDNPYSLPAEGSFVQLADAVHGYPVTRIGWEPSRIYRETWKDLSTELLTTCGDALRIWEFTSDDYAGAQPSSYVGRQASGPAGKLEQKIALSSNKNPNPTTAPLTSFSWNTMAPNLIVTSSIDTTCTVWDIASSAAVTQLIAHDREVYDVAWVPGSVDAFVSVGADGSLRAFDLRSLEHSTILYETPSPNSKKSAAGTPNNAAAAAAAGGSSGTPAALLRLAFNPYDANYLATFHTDSPDVQILDMRSPGRPVVELKAHSGPLTAVGWSRQDSGIVATASDDCQVLIWDLGSQGLYSSQASSSRSPLPDGTGGSASGGNSSAAGHTKITTDPYLAYTAPSEIHNLAWSPNLVGGAYTREDGRGMMAPSGEWVAIAAGKSIRALKV
ncbi:WD40 repeat-like protein [Clavulina sp. PMI_390]|nr:WD40 repeat-like protein [Clavulina sp. PMI_390]